MASRLSSFVRLEIFCTLSCVLVFTSCALPPREKAATVGGVSSRELAVASLVERGIEAFRSGSDDEAVALFRVAYDLAPDSLPVSRNFGTALLQIGAFEEADALFSELVEQRPKDAEILFARANARRGRQAFREALADYRRAMTMAEGLSSSNQLVAAIGRTLADTLFRVGLTAESRCVSERVLSYASGREDLRRHARILRSMGLYQVAKDTIQGQVSDAELEQEPTLLFELALAEYGLGDQEQYQRRREQAVAAAEGNTFLREQFQMVFLLAEPSTKREMLKGRGFIESELVFLPTELAERWYDLTGGIGSTDGTVSEGD